jgi:hypothetical protein
MQGSIFGVLIPQSLGKPKLPLKTKEIRFAIGTPNGLTSNSYKVWATKAKGKTRADIYAACRDNWREFKVSLHESSKWRAGYVSYNVKLPRGCELQPGQDKAWDKWDPPKPLDGSEPSQGSAIVALHFRFATTELAVTPEMRKSKEWEKVMMITPPPEGVSITVTILLVEGNVHFTPPKPVAVQPLAELPVAENVNAVVVAYEEPDAALQEMLTQASTNARAQTDAAGVLIPDGAYFYFFGKGEDGSRFVTGARANR